MRQKEVYELFNNYAPYMGIWIGIFYGITLYRIHSKSEFDYKSIVSELPALPLLIFLT